MNTNNDEFLRQLLNRAFGDTPYGFDRHFAPRSFSKVDIGRDNDFYDEILNRDKYKDGKSQADAYSQFCLDTKQNETVRGFQEWLDAPWKSAKEANTSGIVEGDIVYIRDSNSLWKVDKLKFSKNGDVWAEVISRPHELDRVWREVLPITQLTKAERKSWSKQKCIDMLGMVIEDTKDGTVEKMMRVRTGKDGKIYVNGTCVDELANSWVLYDTREPCCEFVKKTRDDQK